MLRIYVYYCLFAAVSRISGTARYEGTTAFSQNCTNNNDDNNSSNSKNSSSSSSSSSSSNNNVYGTARSEGTTA